MELTKINKRVPYSGRRGGEACSSLVLASTVVCDVNVKPYQPSLFQVREYCTIARHSRCPLRRAIVEQERR